MRRGEILAGTVVVVLLACPTTLSAGDPRHQPPDLSSFRGRMGWKGPIEQWYWLFGNPRRISLDFFYGIGPFLDRAVRINEQTRSVLYDASPRRLLYQKGIRPVLEEVVAAVTKNSTTPAQKAEALLKWVHDLRVDPTGEKGRYVPRLPAKLPEDPGSPEQVIRTGGGSCEWVTRLYVSLLQVADIPARLVVRLEEGWKTQVLGQFPWPVSRQGPVQLYLRCQGDQANVWLDGRHLGRVRGGLWPAGRVVPGGIQRGRRDLGPGAARPRFE